MKKIMAFALTAVMTLALLVGWILLDVILNIFPERYVSWAVGGAALLGWGGLSVHCQTASVLDGTNVPLDRYFLGKALQSLLSALLAAALWHVIPPAA